MGQHHRELHMKYHAQENATFKGGEPTWANACVGENGNPQIFEYASGFAAAANVLLDAVIENRGAKFYVDVFIYPICFNMRHAVELFLKGSVNPLTHIANLRKSKVPEFDVAESHDLGRIWEHVKLVALVADKRYVTMITALEEYVSDIAKLDATGQVFRYPFDKEKQKHLTARSVINAVVLKKRFKDLEDLLHELNRFNEHLSDEYAWGSFTTHLSRVQLLKLATELPERDKWKERSFDAEKALLKTTYNLSSNEFCRALKIIEKRHEMANLIGITVQIPGLDLQGLQAFIDVWSKMHDIEELRNPPSLSFDEIDFESAFPSGMQVWHETIQQYLDVLTNSMNPDCFAAVRALYYFHRETPYSEVFDLLLKKYRKEAIRYLTDLDIYKRDALPLLNTNNVLKDILNSLNFLGQTKLLDSVIEHYGLENCRNRLLDFSEARKMRLKEFSAA